MVILKGHNVLDKPHVSRIILKFELLMTINFVNLETTFLIQKFRTVDKLNYLNSNT